MKRRPVIRPTEEEIKGYDNVPVPVAAKFIGTSATTLYRALKDGRAPFGFAVHSVDWSYNISPGLLIAYKNGTLQIKIASPAA